MLWLQLISLQGRDPLLSALRHFRTGNPTLKAYLYLQDQKMLIWESETFYGSVFPNHSPTLDHTGAGHQNW